MNEQRRRYNELAGQSLDRLAGISDGIFAVGMTLLVLGLALPASSVVTRDSDLLNALWNLKSSMLVYLLSFMTLGIFWVGQSTQLVSWSGATRTTPGSNSCSCSRSRWSPSRLKSWPITRI